MERIRMAGLSRLYIHGDAARLDRPGETLLVQEVRDVIDQNLPDGSCQVFYKYRSENAGLRHGVSDALNWFFEKEPYGIVLEDDCIPDLSFFKFCNELLEYYEYDSRVMHIGGSNLAAGHTSALPESYVFSRFCFVWGWASWRRAWKHFSLELKGLDEMEHSGKMEAFLPGPMARAYMSDKFRVTRAEKLQSWAYAWFYSILNRDGICVVPSVNLIQNIGIGEEGATNTTGYNATAKKKSSEMHFPLIHPVSQQVDPVLEREFFYTSQKKRLRLWLWFLLKKTGLR
jgi:hypothetical protein